MRTHQPIRRIGITFMFAIVLLSLASGVMVAGAVADPYRTFPTCNVYERPPRSDSTCVVGDGFGAIFIAKRQAHIHYRLCFRPPHGDKRCLRKGTGRAGKPSRVGLFLSGGRNPMGTWRLVWKHGGHVVDRDRLHIRSEGV